MQHLKVYYFLGGERSTVQLTCLPFFNLSTGWHNCPFIHSLSHDSVGYSTTHIFTPCIHIMLSHWLSAEGTCNFHKRLAWIHVVFDQMHIQSKPYGHRWPAACGPLTPDENRPPLLQATTLKLTSWSTVCELPWICVCEHIKQKSLCQIVIVWLGLGRHTRKHTQNGNSAFYTNSSRWVKILCLILLFSPPGCHKGLRIFFYQ